MQGDDLTALEGTVNQLSTQLNLLPSNLNTRVQGLEYQLGTSTVGTENRLVDRLNTMDQLATDQLATDQLHNQLLTGLHNQLLTLNMTVDHRKRVPSCLRESPDLIMTLLHYLTAVR